MLALATDWQRVTPSHPLARKLGVVPAPVSPLLRSAMHEASHCGLADTVGGLTKVELLSVTIVPRVEPGRGIVRGECVTRVTLRTPVGREAELQAMIALAGVAASRRLLGHAYGVRSDLAEVRRLLAGRMHRLRPLYATTVRVLESRHHDVRRLAQLLMRERTISGADARKVLNSTRYER